MKPVLLLGAAEEHLMASAKSAKEQLGWSVHPYWRITPVGGNVCETLALAAVSV